MELIKDHCSYSIRKASYVFFNRCSGRASNSVDASATVLTSLPAGYLLTTNTGLMAHDFRNLPRHVPRKRQGFKQFVYCFVRVRYSGHAFNSPLPSNDNIYTCHNSRFSAFMSKYTKNTGFIHILWEKVLSCIHYVSSVKTLRSFQKEVKEIHGIKTSDVER
jgi:hypothetical protein